MFSFAERGRIPKINKFKRNNMRTERAKTLMLMLGVVFILSAIPIAQIIVCVYGNWHGVPPPGVTVDQFYYLARLKQIDNGYPFMGNPFIFEHRNALAPAFFVPDWISAIPLLLGLSLNATAAFNMVFWPLLLSLICYFIFEQLGLKPGQSLFASVLAYFQVYWLMARPVSMQLIFPFFALFLLSYILWLKSPLDKKRILFLILSFASSFYIYAHLWIIIFTMLFLTCIFLIFKKQWKPVSVLLFSGVISVVLALPAIMYTVRQIADPFYWETMARISLVFTRIPPMEFFYYSYWVFIAIVLGLIIWFLDLRENEDRYPSHSLIIFFITGIALLIAAGSNIVLQKEMETANHIGRFIIFWFSIFYVYFLFQLWSKRMAINCLPLIKKALICLAALAASFLFLKNSYIQILDFFARIDKNDIVSAQDYALPFAWLDGNLPPEQVIWTLDLNTELYAPLLTRHYLLFSELAGLQLMPAKELEERYLVSNYFSDLTLEDIERDFRRYTGTGVAIHQYKTHNREVRACQILRLEKFGYSCGKIETDISFKGEDYFIDLYDKYINEIKPNIKAELKKYRVSHILMDKGSDKLKMPITDLRGLEIAYQDGRFVIYKINY